MILSFSIMLNIRRIFFYIRIKSKLFIHYPQYKYKHLNILNVYTLCVVWIKQSIN